MTPIMFRFRLLNPTRVGIALSACLTTMLHAQNPSPAPDSGDSAWILASTALVLMMTVPGLALFYGGLVRARNVLSVMAQCAGVACLASILWVVAGYSLVFKGDGGWIGNLDAAFLRGVDLEAVAPGTRLPEVLFVVFQMTFAIITPCLYIGAVVERMKFSAMLLVSGLWLLLVYVPVGHWVWGGGWLQDMGVKDLAGGIVVHVTAGVSALVLALMIGKRRGFPERGSIPHSPGMVFIGAGMLWVGWFGFNAGSQLKAGGPAAMTLLVTHLSACTAGLVWALIERLRNGKPGMVGLVTGLVGGLATITPAAGDVGPAGAMAIGAVSAVVCYSCVVLIREKLKIDDSLDVFAVHGVGGIIGTLMLACFGQSVLGGLGLVKPFAAQLGIQATGVAVTSAWSAGVTALIVWLVGRFTELRVTPDQEHEGLDFAEHGECATQAES